MNFKENSKFGWSGICWDFSLIPLPIWKAADRHTNLIETLHADVNLEGKGCTLLAGMIKGKKYDADKLTTIRVSIVICFLSE